MTGGRLIGSIIGAGFGMVWVLWAASVLTGSNSFIVRVVGLTIGVSAIAAGIQRIRTLPKTQERSFSRQPAYLIIIFTEIIAIRGGELLLNNVFSIHHLDAGWVAFVVGLHFLALARFTRTPFFYPVGVIMTLSAIGAASGYNAHWNIARLTLVAAIPSAVTLLAAGWYGVLASPRLLHN